MLALRCLPALVLTLFPTPAPDFSVFFLLRKQRPALAQRGDLLLH